MVVYITTAFLSGYFLLQSRLFNRQELQTINLRFESRPWLQWDQESLRRLNPSKLWDYHESHEIPKKWTNWDYTLSYLLENNHPQPKLKVIVFNHLLEDEPPQEAINSFPWMKPLLSHPLPRATLAEIINYLAKGGAKAIILDNDFPQFTPDDSKLAQAIHDAASGKTAGYPVPVYMARTVNRRSSGSVLQLEVPSSPTGVLEALQKLEPDQDVESKYTGITGVLPDEDQVVRQLALNLPSLTGKEHQSLVLKAAQYISAEKDIKAPDIIDINFSGPPNSELYPVRPLSYLLDPSRREAMLHPHKDSSDVTLKGALVIIGDGVIDVFNTPFTNLGLNQMSGSEVLANAVDTVLKRNWLTRIEDQEAILFMFFVSVISGLFWIIWKLLTKNYFQEASNSVSASLMRLFLDMSFLGLMLICNYLVACFLLYKAKIIIPLFVPSLSILLGSLALILWEREKEREEVFRVKLQSAQDKLELAEAKYVSDLKRQEAEAQAREVLQDRKRRHEFVRRINHDLNAPVSVLNWTLAEMQDDENMPQDTQNKVDRLVKTSDKLGDLIDQLVRSYDFDKPLEGEQNEGLTACDLSKIIEESVYMQRPLADMSESSIAIKGQEDSLWIKGKELEIGRIIDNIIRNAIKHNPHGTKVTVSAKSNGSFHYVTIEDNGRGIPPEHLEHIFEAGYRAQPNLSEGSGLGLDIVKNLIDKYQGEVDVKSAVGKGTTFTLKFPICTNQEAASILGSIKTTKLEQE